ncbi:tRNA 2-thiouridine(34) synthase MnmA [Desulfatirhabdium butyrativorans]|uniref:tRNA 2-thiouridine(34) synthase MnmA n=1 Tax=Desulfatirhabdium butyrativorans TaxID=340467 RepID=UPI00040C567B|nr:tRNA 2-thiouridine(34) synthase MnmA [Desulfatirhabdium butyrativorans]
MISAAVAVALSGGVDSLVAAALLKKRYERIIGLHFSTGFETPGMAETVVSHLRSALDIEIVPVDLQEAFRRHVVDYFIRTYLDGKTPNPCLVCNASIKYGLLLAEAGRRGASLLATGHYARLSRDASDQIHLRKGRDTQKDQSYFLSRIPKACLKKALFPLGNLTKQHVRKLALLYGLTPFHHKESQDVCFIRGMSYEAFLSRQTETGPVSGEILDATGKRIGMHEGLWKFTIGQRKGIRCPSAEPYYVLRLDPANNRIIVGRKAELLVSGCTVQDINWIEPPPDAPRWVRAKLRYRHEAIEALLIPDGAACCTLKFRHPHPAVTPGQGAVFYEDDLVLGGGWIDEALPVA